MLKAYLIDCDDTLTRVPDISIYARAQYAACGSLLGHNDFMPFDDFVALKADLFYSADCHFSAIAKEFGLNVGDVFRAHHHHMEIDQIIFDNSSADALNQIADRAVIFTDGNLDWASRCGVRIGHGLKIVARDENGSLLHRKAFGEQRWHDVLADLKEMTGDDLKPSEVLKIDDSVAVLRHAQNLGFATAHCHWGHPGREHTTEFDFSIHSVGDFLIEQGVVPAKPKAEAPQSSSAPAA